MLMSYARARGECGFNFLGSWSYSKEWVWNLGTKSMLHCFRKVKCQLGDIRGSSLPEFNVNYKLLWGSHDHSMSVAYWLARQGLTAKIQDCFPDGQVLL